MVFSPGYFLFSPLVEERLRLHSLPHPEPLAPGRSPGRGGTAGLPAPLPRPRTSPSTASQPEAQPPGDPSPVLTCPLTLPLPCRHLSPPCPLPYPCVSALTPALSPCTQLGADSTLTLGSCPSPRAILVPPGQARTSLLLEATDLTPHRDAPVLFPSPDTPSAVWPTGQDFGASCSPILPPVPSQASVGGPSYLSARPSDLGRRGSYWPPSCRTLRQRADTWLSRGRVKAGRTLPHPGHGGTGSFQGEGGSVQFSREKTQELHPSTHPSTPKQSISAVLNHMITMPVAPLPPFISL